MRIQIIFLLEIQLHRGTKNQDCLFVSNGFFSAEFSAQEVCHDLCGLGTGGGSLQSKLFPSRSAIRPCATAISWRLLPNRKLFRDWRVHSGLLYRKCPRERIGSRPAAPESPALPAGRCYRDIPYILGDILHQFLNGGTPFRRVVS